MDFDQKSQTSSDPEKLDTRVGLRDPFKAIVEAPPRTEDDVHQFNAADLDKVQRRLKQRHIQM